MQPETPPQNELVKGDGQTDGMHDVRRLTRMVTDPSTEIVLRRSDSHGESVRILDESMQGIAIAVQDATDIKVGEEVVLSAPESLVQSDLTAVVVYMAPLDRTHWRVGLRWT